MKTTKRTILFLAGVLILTAVALAGIRIYRHEKDQNEALRELSEQMIVLQEQKQAAEQTVSEGKIAELTDRITRMEIQAEYTEADYSYFAIGNSITVHEPNEVWWNEIGMAASSADRDFVHLVAAYCSGMYGEVAVHPLYFYAWETAGEKRGEKLAMLDPYLDPRLQLVTIQLGENTEDLMTFERDFEELIRYVQGKAPEARILVIDDFWTDDDRGRKKREAAEKTGAEFVSLEGIRDNPEYQAGIGAVVYDSEGNPHTVENRDVAGHPGDAGMQYIADQVVKVLEKEP